MFKSTFYRCRMSTMESRDIAPSIYHIIETAHPPNCTKKQGVVFTLFELVIWRIEVSILIWTIIDTAKDNGDCTNIRKKKTEKLQLFREQAKKKNL